MRPSRDEPDTLGVRETMRLLNVHTFEFGKFYGDNIPSYVIASHRWTAEEATYKNVLREQGKTKLGFKKLLNFAEFVKRGNEFLKCQDPEWPVSDWIWMDTCCIDQRSSAELSESINSMFTWYSNASECVAYLADVRPLSMGMDIVMDDFENSEWFLRGWTLQELLAPKCVIFVNQEWEVIGHKCSHCVNRPTCGGVGVLLNQAIANITGISEEILGDYAQSRKLSAYDKMNWMQNRRTTKTEDMAYCMLGIFDVNMPLIYGEGAKAVTRLEQEIQQRSDQGMTFAPANLSAFYTPFSDQNISTTRTERPPGQLLPNDCVVDPSAVTQALHELPSGIATTEISQYRPNVHPDFHLPPLHSPLLDRVIRISKRYGPPKPLKSRADLTDHFECLHKQCARAGVKFARQEDLERHIAKAHNEHALKIFRCKFNGCKFQSRRKDKLAAHQASEHDFRTPLPRDPGS